MSCLIVFTKGAGEVVNVTAAVFALSLAPKPSSCDDREELVGCAVVINFLKTDPAWVTMLPRLLTKLSGDLLLSSLAASCEVGLSLGVNAISFYQKGSPQYAKERFLSDRDRYRSNSQLEIRP